MPKARYDRAVDKPDWDLFRSLHASRIPFESPSLASDIWAMEDMAFDHGRCSSHGLGFERQTYEKRDARTVFTSKRLERTLVKSFRVA